MIEAIWKELENDKSFEKGLLIRRYSATIVPDVFVAMQKPELYFCFAASVSNKIDIDLSAFENLQDIQVSVLPDLHQSKCLIIFKLTNNQHKDIFGVLCDDLLKTIEDVSSETKLVAMLLNRFEKWKSLFNKYSTRTLSRKEQIGLFGELYFLRKFLKFCPASRNVMKSWVGTSKEIRDFQHGNWALEVKTTVSKNHQKVHISSERQLDETNLGSLFLYHLALERMYYGGETLQQIVESLYNMLADDIENSNRLRVKLFEVGYFDSQSEEYISIGYSVRQENYYKVEGDFPRVRENEVRTGVGDVKYTIIVSQCQAFLKNEVEVFTSISSI